MPMMSWVEIQPWSKDRQCSLLRVQRLKTEACRLVAKHIGLHCSIYKQPCIPLLSQSTPELYTIISYSDEKDKERPPWRPICCCCGCFLSNSPAWPWPFQAPKVLVRYKLQSNYSYRDNCEHFLASVTNKKVVLKPNPIFRREKVWSHRGHASRGPPRAVW